RLEVVGEAADPYEARELIKALQPDVLTLDVEMPRMNGFQLAQNIRKHPLYGKVPLLAVSSRADKNYTDEGAKAGFNIYLEKLKTEDLLHAVRSLTQKEEAAA
ncbi:MAG TPA: response regulator, partial [Bdellovibrionales bacterium]|nr:response regulator [Bdellovibrionales bacterium]